MWKRALFGCFVGLVKCTQNSHVIVHNLWKLGQRADLFVYVTESPTQTVFSDDQLVWSKNDIEFGSFDSNQSGDHQLTFDVSNELFAHIYLVKKGFHHDPRKSGYDPIAVIHTRQQLVGQMTAPAKRGNLFSGHRQAEAKESVPYWYPELHISLVAEDVSLDLTNVPPYMSKHIQKKGKFYYPIVYLNEFWHLKERRVPLDQPTANVPLKLTFNQMSMAKFQFLVNLDHSFKVNEEMLGATNGSGASDLDGLKRMFLENSPYILALTFAVSLLHSIFDFLAFKNGLSVRSILINSAFQLIILFYLLDQEASWVVLGSVAVGVVIEIWKIFRVLRVEIGPRFPFVRFHDRASYARTRTREYDEQAVRWLTVVAIPLLVAYASYSLLYQNHKSWYSWVLGSLVGFVYTFGFIMMTPQLFINYKLRSVAHMPWRVFVYKALNTFIDDLFAFVIKMPLLHRLACFRDDVVFLVYLYQRWIYPVDKTRPNEFGQVFDEKDCGDKKVE